MASLTGMLNGTTVLIQLEISEGGGTFASLAGQVGSENTLETSLISIANKSSGGVQEFLEGEGAQAFSISANCIFNTDASFVRAQTVSRDKLGVLTRLKFSTGETWEGRTMIPTFNESADNEAAFTAAITFNSTGPFAWS